MTTYPCADCGGQSNDANTCSQCGAPMTAAAQANAASVVAANPVTPVLPVAAGATAAGDCPSCQMPRFAGDEICPFCGKNYTSGAMVAPAALPVADLPGQSGQNPSLPLSPAAAVIVPAPASGLQWKVSLTYVERGVQTEGGQPSNFPANESEHVFDLVGDQIEFGRHSAAMQIANDSGVSGHHGKFIKNADGSYSLRDIGSTNGTRVNNQSLNANETRLLKDGDIIDIGLFVTMKVSVS